MALDDLRPTSSPGPTSSSRQWSRELFVAAPGLVDRARRPSSAHTTSLPASPQGVGNTRPSSSKSSIQSPKKSKVEYLNGVFRFTGEAIVWRRGNAIGHGVEGTVYRAIDESNGRPFAVKEVKCDDQAEIDKIVSDIECLKKTDKHKPIVRVLGYDLMDGSQSVQGNYRRTRSDLGIYIYYELMSGGTVASLLREFHYLSSSDSSVFFEDEEKDQNNVKNNTISKPPKTTNSNGLPEWHCQWITYRVLEALDYLHNLQVIHRDVKTENILLDLKGRAYLGDFGRSKFFQECESSLQHTPHGTLLYMSPEMFRGEGYGRKCDIWSLGCVLVEMLSGLKPWGGKVKTLGDLAEVFSNLKESAQPHMPKFVEGRQITGELKDFLDVCLHVDPHKRWGAGELLEHVWLKSIREYVLSKAKPSKKEKRSA
eukprot:GDKJ01050158.1.p1 GENE.GDKJ01050158.1~~GDKJ01050158.1.p1  ORF type:complete len:425 (-),score=46.82 GDKJ01050158.1:83-1357(-)